MLSSLKEYLGGVTQRTLCIEEHLYEHISAIQFSCLNNNTIPEAHCFAFDFTQNSSTESVKGNWDLIYTKDSREFRAKTNRETH